MQRLKPINMRGRNPLILGALGSILLQACSPSTDLAMKPGQYRVEGTMRSVHYAEGERGRIVEDIELDDLVCVSELDTIRTTEDMVIANAADKGCDLLSYTVEKFVVEVELSCPADDDPRITGVIDSRTVTQYDNNLQKQTINSVSTASVVDGYVETSVSTQSTYVGPNC